MNTFLTGERIRRVACGESVEDVLKATETENLRGQVCADIALFLVGIAGILGIFSLFIAFLVLNR